MLGEKLYAIGGYNEAYVFLKSVEAYDPDTNEWSHVADMSVRRVYAGAASYGGQIYLAGGQNDSCWLDSIVVLTPASNTWNASWNMRLSDARGLVGVTVLF